jgi:hypothetical protein
VSRDRKAQVVTIVILTGALVLVAAKRSGWQPAAAVLRTSTSVTPEDTVYRMLDAARDGDVSAYLSCYTGSMEISLRQIVKEKGESGLAEYIRNFNASIKGVALQAPHPVSDNEVRERVEFVYSDRNEAQIYYLQRKGSRWQIARQENAESVKALMPYGTPVE